MELAALFTELSGFEFKRGEKFKGVAYTKGASALFGHSEPVTGGSQAGALPGIQEFIETGKIERLERYRNGDLED